MFKKKFFINDCFGQRKSRDLKPQSHPWSANGRALWMQEDPADVSVLPDLQQDFEIAFSV